MGCRGLLERLKTLNKKEFNTEEVINMLLYSIVIIMPFIVVKGEYYSIQNMGMENQYVLPLQYHFGKVIYIYIIAVVLLILLLKSGVKLNKFCKLALLYLGCYGIATIFSIDKMVSIWGNDFRFEGILMIGCYILFFIISSNYLIINEKIIKLSIISVSLMSIYSLLQLYGFDPIQVWLYGEKLVSEAYGVMRHRNIFGSYLSLFIPISMGIFILKGKKFYFITSCIIFSAIIASMTRAVWVSFVVFSIVGLIFILKRKECLKRSIYIFSAFSMIFILINITNSNTLNGMNIRDRAKSILYDAKNINEDSGAYRIGIWKDAITCFKTNPIFGSGPDTLKIKLDSMGLKQKETHIDKAHNEFIELLETGGITTLISYLILILLLFKELIKRQDCNDNIKIMILVLVSYLVQSFFSNSVILVAPIYWIMLGGIVKYLNNDINKKKE